MNEEVVKFGKSEQLVGVLSSGQEEPDAPVAIFFNAGFLHRIGPFRLWVDVARELACKNIASLRFDLHGLGDSPALSFGGDAVKSAISDLSEAMDLVESRLGKRSFVVFGLCSGADYAHPAAKADPRIRGLVMIDGYGYKTKSFFIHRQLRRMFSFRRWMNMAKRAVRRHEEVSLEVFKGEDARQFPASDQIQSEILSFLDEGRRLFYIYTAGVPDYFNYQNQFWEMFPKLKSRSGISYSYYPKTDHTFALVRERAELTGRLVRFMTGATI